MNLINQYKINNLIIPIRHEKARHGISVLLSWFHGVTSSAARKGILERCVVSLVDASLAVDAYVADLSVVDIDNSRNERERLNKCEIN